VSIWKDLIIRFQRRRDPLHPIEGEAHRARVLIGLRDLRPLQAGLGRTAWLPERIDDSQTNRAGSSCPGFNNNLDQNYHVRYWGPLVLILRELHPLTIPQIAITIALDGEKVNKHTFSTMAMDFLLLDRHQLAGDFRLDNCLSATAEQPP